MTVFVAIEPLAHQAFKFKQVEIDREVAHESRTEHLRLWQNSTDTAQFADARTCRAFPFFGLLQPAAAFRSTACCGKAI